MSSAALTPVHEVFPFKVKRDDLYEVAGVSGGKARTCWALSEGAQGLITASARSSPQAVIVAYIARERGIPAHIHVPMGAPTRQLELATMAGAKLVKVRPGYNSVIIASAKHDLAEHPHWTYIPFGMECATAVRQTAGQVANLPFDDISRIVVPVGSGMSLAGVLTGLLEYAPRKIDVLGVAVGANPTKRLDKYAPVGWRWMAKIVASLLPYSKPAPITHLGNIKLDEIYEAKCIAYLEPHDLLWVVGIREGQS